MFSSPAILASRVVPAQSRLVSTRRVKSFIPDPTSKRSPELGAATDEGDLESNNDNLHLDEFAHFTPKPLYQREKKIKPSES